MTDRVPFQDGQPILGSLYWPFENKKAMKTEGDKSKLEAVPSSRQIIGFLTQDGGGPSEEWDEKKVMITRYFGKYFPYIKLFNTCKIQLKELNFRHYQNNNNGFGTYPDYKVGIKVDETTLEKSCIAGPGINFGKTETINFNEHWVLAPGEHTITWFPSGLNLGWNDTGSEYFALDFLTLSFIVLLD